MILQALHYVPTVLAVDLLALWAVIWLDRDLPGEPIGKLAQKHPRITLALFPTLLIVIWLVVLYRKWNQANQRWFWIGSNLIVLGLLAVLIICIVVPQLETLQVYMVLPVLLWIAREAERYVRDESQGSGGPVPAERPSAPESQELRGTVIEMKAWLRLHFRQPKR
ncbi:MAG TPA: hypothetical protein VNG90_01765 [Candidatus Acidoferrum sp.]|nr:hypothetical protein [Candidatus Acidoferrum sp.]